MFFYINRKLEENGKKCMGDLIKIKGRLVEERNGTSGGRRRGKVEILRN